VRADLIHGEFLHYAIESLEKWIKFGVNSGVISGIRVLTLVLTRNLTPKYVN